jgi:hypothetical protein
VIEQMAERGLLEVREDAFDHTLVRLTPKCWFAIRKAAAGPEHKPRPIGFEAPD